jgi:hypothetical protein
MLPLPAHLHDAIRINWHITSWCNYSCEYCPVVVFHQRSRTGQVQPHAFDFRPVEDWLAAFEKFPFRQIHLNISGGEPFLDRKHFPRLLEGLTASERIRTSVITNAFWDPADYAGIDRSRLALVVTYHPTQAPLGKFLDRVLRIRDAGFKITMVNFVLAPENMEHAETVLSTFEEAGFAVNISAMMPAGLYWARSTRSEAELDLIERYNTPCDNYFKLVRPPTKGQLCFYPAMTYYLLYDGSVQVACMDGTARNLFTDDLPRVPREAVPCAYEECVGCSDMYRSLVDHPRVQTPLGFFGPNDYVDEFRKSRREYVEAKDRAPFSVRAMLAEVRKPEPLISIEPWNTVPTSPSAESPIFGFNDQARIVARSRDRISISGWAASRADGAPVREVRIAVDEREVGIFRDFFDRPDVANMYGRPDLIRSGWRGMVYLPQLPHGEYKLVPRAFDHRGNVAALPSCIVSIAD